MKVANNNIGDAQSLPQGYKQTEIGVIPEDWEVENISDFASITTGGSDTQDRIDEGIYPFYVRSDKIERINKYSFDGEAILTSGDGVGVGKVFHYVNGKFDYHQRVYNIYDYRKDVDGKYLFFQFSTNFYKKVMSMTAKSSVDSVRREMIADMKIPLPPTLTEQKAIATALSDVDALISSLDQLITKKKAIKQGAMQELLTPPHTCAEQSRSKGGKRLPGFDGEWEEKTLGELAQMNSGGTPSSKTSEYYDGNINWVSITDISNAGKYIFNSIRKITEKGLENSSARLFPMNTLLLAMYASIGKCCIAKSDVSTSQAILGINTSKYLDTEFLYYFLIFKKNELLSQGQQGTQANLNKGMVQDIEMNLPNIEEQKAIAKILSDMDLEIEQLEAKKAKYQQIKQGMMQELLTGKIRFI